MATQWAEAVLALELRISPNTASQLFLFLKQESNCSDLWMDSTVAHTPCWPGGVSHWGIPGSNWKGSQKRHSNLQCAWFIAVSIDYIISHSRKNKLLTPTPTWANTTEPGNAEDIFSALCRNTNVSLRWTSKIDFSQAWTYPLIGATGSIVLLTKRIGLAVLLLDGGRGPKWRWLAHSQLKCE